MKAILLAAGEGSRLRPLTDERPKCLVELVGVSLLERQTRVLRAAGVDSIAVVAGYRSDLLEGRGLQLFYNRDYRLTNMVTTLFCAKDWLVGDEDLLVSYGDIVYEPRVLRAVMSADAPVNVVVDRGWRSYWERRMADPLQDAETLKLDEANNIRELGKKPRSLDEIEGQYIGLFKFRRDAVASIDDAYASMDRSASYDGKDFANMYMTSFLQHLIDSGESVAAVSVTHGWLEVDTVSDLELYETMHRAGTLDAFCKLD